jgi:hypothetical protein
MPTPIVLANIALCDTRSLLHMDDPQYSCGDMGKSGELVYGGLVLSEHGMDGGTHLVKAQRNPKDDISPSQRLVISSCLVLPFPALPFSVLSCSLAGFFCLIAILEDFLSLRTNHTSHAGHQRCKRCCLQREGSD